MFGRVRDAKSACDALGVRRLIEVVVGKSYGKSFYFFFTDSSGIVRNRGAVEPSAQKHAERHVTYESPGDTRLEHSVKRTERPVKGQIRGSACNIPKTFFFGLRAACIHQVTTRLQLPHPFKNREGSRHIFVGEVQLQCPWVDLLFEIFVAHKRLQFRTKYESRIEDTPIQGFFAEPVAHQ